MADDSKDGSEKDRNAPTVRDLSPRALPTDTVPELVGQYAPPRPLPEPTQHRTLDLRSVRVSEQFDPRRAPTELRLESPRRAEARSSGWWLVGGLVLLVGVAAWLLVRAFAPSNEVTPAPVPSLANPAPIVETPPARPTASAALAPAAPAPLASPPSALAASGDRTVSPAETPTASSAVPRAKAPPDTEKKRREPWLE